MQFQRALTVGKLLLGHNLVNLCSIPVLSYLTQPYTLTQDFSPSLWPACKLLPMSKLINLDGTVNPSDC